MAPATLQCKLTFTDPLYGATTYYLMTESIDHVFIRAPAQAGLPGVQSTKGGFLTVDLGVCTPQITVNGVVNTTSSDIGDPSKVNLERVVNYWWQYGADSTLLPQLTLPGGSIYPVSVKMASFHIDAALEDRWLFSIIFLVSVATS